MFQNCISNSNTCCSSFSMVDSYSAQSLLSKGSSELGADRARHVDPCLFVFFNRLKTWLWANIFEETQLLELTAAQTYNQNAFS